MQTSLLIRALRRTGIRTSVVNLELHLAWALNLYWQHVLGNARCDGKQEDRDGVCSYREDYVAIWPMKRVTRDRRGVI